LLRGSSGAFAYILPRGQPHEDEGQLAVALSSATSLIQVWLVIDKAVSKSKMYCTLLHEHCCMAFAETIKNNRYAGSERNDDAVRDLM